MARPHHEVRFSKLATPNHIGKPIIPLPGTETGWRPEQGWDGKCWTNDTASWALHAGAVDYNTKNPCCLRYNGGGTSWARLEFTWQGQARERAFASALSYDGKCSASKDGDTRMTLTAFVRFSRAFSVYLSRSVSLCLALSLCLGYVVRCFFEGGVCLADLVRAP